MCKGHERPLLVLELYWWGLNWVGHQPHEMLVYINRCTYKYFHFIVRCIRLD